MKNLNNKKDNTTIDKYIILVIFSIFAIFKSFKILTELFTYGIFKKEILTYKSNLGFDMKITIK